MCPMSCRGRGSIGDIVIEWCSRHLPNGVIIPGYSFNPWIGCLKIASECHFCYAETFAQRWGWKVWGPASTTHRRVTSTDNWKKPHRWNREAQAQGHRRNVFCASLADVFENHPDVGEAREHLWQLIEATPWLNWLLLTKRPENMVTMAPTSWGDAWPNNVWAGTSAGTQASADKNVPHLLKVPAVVRFVSCEPHLEEVNFRPYLDQLHWMICGGESGEHARPYDLTWARDVREQCQEYNIPYFFKQIGGRYHNSGGRLLDGQFYNEMPPEFPIAG